MLGVLVYQSETCRDNKSENSCDEPEHAKQVGPSLVTKSICFPARIPVRWERIWNALPIQIHRQQRQYTGRKG